jgi:hypothetical protein
VLLLGAVLLVVAFAVLVRTVGGTRPASGIQRAYVMLTPLPLVLSIIVPAVVGLSVGFVGRHTVWLHGATWAGVVFSALLGLMGVVLIVQSKRRGEAWGWPLGASVVLAAMPFGVIVLGVGLMYLVWR